MEIARLLLAYGARPATVVVAEAAREGSAPELLRIFLDATGGAAGATAALAVATSASAVQRLIAAGANATAYIGEPGAEATALIAACKYTTRLLSGCTRVWDLERAEVVVALLAAVAPSPAGKRKRTRQAHWLSVPDVTIDARDGRGRTALAWAALNGYTGAVRALLAAGANSALTGKDGRTALDLALSNQHDYGYHVDRTVPWHVKRMEAVVRALRVAS
jgi:hypothetical protein